jgi:hypothetical protein
MLAERGLVYFYQQHEKVMPGKALADFASQYPLTMTAKAQHDKFMPGRALAAGYTCSWLFIDDSIGPQLHASSQRVMSIVLWLATCVVLPACVTTQ